MKRSLLAVAFCGFAGSLAAQGLNWIDGGSPAALYQPGFFGRDSASAMNGLPMYGFLNGREFPASTSIAHMDVAPLQNSLTFASMSASSAPRSARASDTSKDMPGEIPTVKSDPIYYGGEIGAYYGSSFGRRSGDQYGSYIIGTVGNEHLQITVGAAYEESNYRIPTRVIR